MPVMQSMIQVVKRLVGAYEAENSLLVVADYDVTLTPLGCGPESARVNPRTRRQLQALADLPDVFVGITSDRSVDDLKEIVGLSGIYYAGAGGLELDLLGVRVNHPAAESAKADLDASALALGRLAARYDGAWLEQKPFGLTLHFHDVMDQKAEVLTLEALRILDLASDRLNVRRVAKGLEVTANLDWDWGTALGFILEDAARDAIPVFAGVPPCGLDAMRAARRHGGIAIGVGTEVSREADYHLNSTEDLAEMLEMLRVAIETLLTECLSGVKRAG